MNIIPKNNADFSMVPSDNLFSLILQAVPMSLAKPILEYRKIVAQENIIEKNIEYKKEMQKTILETIGKLAQSNQLSPEILSTLLVTFNQMFYAPPC